MLLKTDGSEATTALDKAETLNTFFASNFTEDGSIDDESQCENPPFLGEYLNHFVITKETVEEKLRQLNPNKSPGPDGWHPSFLKNIEDLISSPLSILFQKSLNEGIVPAQWLEAIVTPIHKKGSKNMFENYRAVSMTSIFCKIMESIIRDRIVTHLEKNKILSDSQHGFVPHRNCMTNLLLAMEKWTEMLEVGAPIDVIYTDFAKAFDRVSHKRLLQKLHKIGIVGNTWNWIRAFLMGRTQRVKVDDAYSTTEMVKSGIPQGSVLGPTLFVVFINDMPDVINSLCQLFADDAKVFRKVISADDSASLQEDIDTLRAVATGGCGGCDTPWPLCQSAHVRKYAFSRHTTAVTS